MARPLVLAAAALYSYASMRSVAAWSAKRFETKRRSVALSASRLPLGTELLPLADELSDVVLIGRAPEVHALGEALAAPLSAELHGDAAALETSREEGKSSRVFALESAVELSPRQREQVREALGIHVRTKDGVDTDEDAAATDCTRYVLPVLDEYREGGAAWQAVEDEAARLVMLGRRGRPSAEEIKLELGKDTFFASLTFDDLEDCLPYLPELCKDVDALEVRADLLKNQNRFDVQYAVSRLRRSIPPNSRTSLGGIIFTVRSADQCGAFPVEGSPDAMYAFLRDGVRCGIEVLDVEWGHDDAKYAAFLKEVRERYPATITLGSFHAVGYPVDMAETAPLVFEKCYANGIADAVKVVFTAYDPEDSVRVALAAKTARIPDTVPRIGICLTERGKLSRVLNRPYSPVTHEVLPVAAAPGQLTPSELLESRESLGLLPQSRLFYLFGGPGIVNSPSPNMHNSAFREVQMGHSHVYGQLPKPYDIDAMQKVLSDPEFGGASVTIPHKQTVIDLIDELTPTAQALGAVNTVIVKEVSVGSDGSWEAGVPKQERRRILLGDNTDCTGMVDIIGRSLKQQREGWDATQQAGSALVLGAGGTARAAVLALQSLGFQVFLWNRTPDKAEEVANDMPGVRVIRSLEEVDETAEMESWPGGSSNPAFDGIRAVVCTVPASAGLTLPKRLLEKRPVVLDASYTPPQTALLTQAATEGCICLRGADLLVAQGVRQWQLWMHRKAPVYAIEEQVEAQIAVLLEKQRAEEMAAGKAN